jgi:hypothetical protein
MYERNTTKENGEVGTRSRHEEQRLYWKQLVYYTISRAFIGILRVGFGYIYSDRCIDPEIPQKLNTSQWSL